VLIIAYLNSVDEFYQLATFCYFAEVYTMYGTLNIVSKWCFFVIFKHSLVTKWSWKNFHGVPGKFWIILSLKKWEPCWKCMCTCVWKMWKMIKVWSRLLSTFVVSYCVFFLLVLLVVPSQSCFFLIWLVMMKSGTSLTVQQTCLNCIHASSFGGDRATHLSAF